MAKYGEGDSRWIVQERADGTNVHNWHWAERNCLEWSRSFLSSRFAGLQLLTGPINARTTALDKLEGEAYVNIRKGKIIPGYELSLTVKWEAEVSGSESKVKGTLEAPYIADENADEDPELRVVVKDGADGPAGKLVREALFAQGRPVVLEKIREFVRAMAAGGPAKDELEVKKPRPQQQNASGPVAGATAPAAAPAPAVVEKKENAGSKTKEGFKTVKMTEKFYCSAKVLYEILLDDNRWRGFTQSNASISKEIGGRFSIFDGSVTGENLDLQEGKLIVQRWRFGSWPDGLHSTVKLEFDEPESGVTVVKLTQTDVPEEDRYGNATVVENTERGWKDLIFHKIRAVFGFGI